MKNMRDILNQVSPKDVTPGELISSVRHRLNMTQEELCHVTGLRRENLSALENGRIEMTVYYAEIFAAALGLHPASILFPNGSYEKSKDILAIEKKANNLLKKKIAV
jgi:transcriptional regulator with XRE-family HTH domain